ncbi:MAG: BNR repeat-containing protein [Puniceicoccaceae bacterium]
MMTHNRFLFLLACLFTANALPAGDSGTLTRTEAIDLVWAGNYVRFDMLHRGEHSFIGYYDANRQLTIAHRYQGTPWVYYKLDSYFGYDSHNYIEMELDDKGMLHVLANMHNHVLEYFRTTRPYDIRSLRRITEMANPAVEQKMTYPNFLRDKSGQLLVKYRDGSSGNGVQIYNRYDAASQTWTPLHSEPLIDGEGLMNAYPKGPTLGPDGRFHLVWVWRDTPDAATNHDLSYARSPDLLSWESAGGVPIPLPITISTGDIVDPVPVHSGMINGGKSLGFDSQNRPLVAYHKFDEDGWTQIYLARAMNGKWVTMKITDWKGFRWEFGGKGSLPSFEVRMHGVRAMDDGTMVIEVKKQGQPLRLTVDEDTLELLSEEPMKAYPPVLNRYASSPEVILNGMESEGEAPVFRTLSASTPEHTYYLSWEAQPPNRGQAREDIPPQSTLRLHTFNRASTKDPAN